MKNNLIVCISLLFSTILCLTSCTKENSAIDSQQKSQGIQTAIIGSWQITEKGFEIAMHEGHICPDPENMPQNQITYVVQWENVAPNERRDFNQNGVFTRYLQSVMICSGTYKVSDAGILEWDTNCDKAFAKVEKISAASMTIRQGGNYFKYQKLD